MGLLNSLLNAAENGAKSAMTSATRQATRQATDKMINSVTNGLRNAVGKNTQNAQSANTSAGNRQQPVQTVVFANPAIPATSKRVAVDDYDCNDQGQEIIQTYCFPVAEGFVEFSSGAGEILASYAYSPQDAAAGYCQNVDFERMPILYIGEESSVGKIVEEYEKKGAVSSGCTIEIISGSFVIYKTCSAKNGHEIVAYHFHKRYHSDYYTQIVIDIPGGAKSSRDQLVNALDCMVAGMQITERNA